MNTHLSAHAPVIGISASTTTMTYIAMCSLLHQAGCQPMLLEHDPALLKEQLDQVDGVVIMGNPWDIKPSDYGASEIDVRIPEEGTPERIAYEKKTAFEKALVEEIVQQGQERKIPLLGICGGHQRINITPDIINPELRAGTIHTIKQSRGDAALNHELDLETTYPYTPIHLIKVEPDSHLATVSKEATSLYAPYADKLPEGVHLINSVHQQAIKEGGVREGFTIAARAEDGTIEAIEADQSEGAPYAGHYIIGVQWHPELGDSAISRAIVNDFMDHAREYQQGRDENYAEAVYAERLSPELKTLMAKPKTEIIAYLEHCFALNTPQTETMAR
jgi:putative glutamine amidotransferase